MERKCDFTCYKAFCTSSAETLQAVCRFCTLIRTMLKILEESIPLANLDELYIGLLKSSVGKDLKESNCPLCL